MNRPKPKITRQEVHFLPLPLIRNLLLQEHPYRVWTLYDHDSETPPTLPITPKHNQGAFLEDYAHDWLCSEVGGQWLFRYDSRVSNEGTWVLLEYADINPFVVLAPE